MPASTPHSTTKGRTARLRLSPRLITADKTLVTSGGSLIRRAV
jgi:hypothetical protein